MKTVLHTADSRGHANHGWLNSYHTFSFANYSDRERIHFGALRVLNDDEIDGGEGFGMHPHDNMEIVTIVLEGAVRHRDTMGTNGIIKPGDVQIMSAGSGLRHSEVNASPSEMLKLLQIWVFPEKGNITPRYNQLSFTDEQLHNTFYPVVGADADEKTGLWINQKAWFNMAVIDEGQEVAYKLHGNGQGAYVFVIEGEIEAGGQKLNRRDALGISETDVVGVKASTQSRVLIIEVPMEF